MNKKVILAMSGGVDSSAAAHILLVRGFEVSGVTLKRWPEDNAWEDAQKAAESLGLPHYVLDVSREFKAEVIDYFTDEYAAGRTPNPCVLCNRNIKFESVLRYANGVGADFIATGHYAMIEKMAGRYYIKKSKSDKKDQTYALYNLTQEQLARTLFPIGDYEKAEIRRIAAEAGLSAAGKKDSQEICFIPGEDYAKYLTDCGVEAKEGNFVDSAGKVLGRHRGVPFYTVGQRKIGVALNEKMFVKSIDPKKNEIVLAKNEELFTDLVECDKINFFCEPFEGQRRLLGKIRYAQRPEACEVRVKNGKITACFDSKVRAVTPGQAAVFYDGEYVQFGGTIV